MITDFGSRMVTLHLNQLVDVRIRERDVERACRPTSCWESWHWVKYWPARSHVLRIRLPSASPLRGDGSGKRHSPCSMRMLTGEEET
jgi:hypothetical protein